MITSCMNSVEAASGVFVMMAVSRYGVKSCVHRVIPMPQYLFTTKTEALEKFALK